jgi:membrane-associated phospholipid phosphatase
MPQPATRSIARALLAAAAVLSVGGLVVVLCYFFVDRQVAWFVQRHHFPHWLLQWPPRISDWLKDGAAVAIGLAVLWWAWRPGGYLQRVLLAVSASLILTIALKSFLKWVSGRYWPLTWKGDNPSLIGSGDYGFHPFHYGVAYESFPSGHAAVMCAAMSVLWFAYPRGRWLYALATAAVCLALVGMNYHFVGDVVGGGLLGWLMGVCVARLLHLVRWLPPAERDGIMRQ